MNRLTIAIAAALVSMSAAHADKPVLNLEWGGDKADDKAAVNVAPEHAEIARSLQDLSDWLALSADKTGKLIIIIADRQAATKQGIEADRGAGTQNAGAGPQSMGSNAQRKKNAEPDETAATALTSLLAPYELKQWQAYEQAAPGRAVLRALNAELAAVDQVKGESAKKAAIALTDVLLNHTTLMPASGASPGVDPAVDLVEAQIKATAPYLSGGQQKALRKMLERNSATSAG